MRPISSFRALTPWPRRAAWLALCLGSSVALAQSTAMPSGDWRGSLSYDKQPLVAVRLWPSGTANGTPLLQLGAPLNCNLNLLAQRDGSYRVEVQNGGAFCDRLYGAKASVQQDGADSVTLRLGDTLELPLHTVAAAPTALAGQWLRAVGDTSLQLSVAAAPLLPGDDLAQLRYGTPRDCDAEARYAGTRDGALVLAFEPTAAGYCSRLSDAYAMLTPAGDGMLLELFDRSGRKLDAMSLVRLP